MKNFIYNSIFILFCLAQVSVLNAQTECMTETTISISPWGQDFVFDEASLTTHGFMSDSFTATPASVSCDDVGSAVTVNCVFVNAGVTSTCDVIVNTVDDTAPVAVAIISLDVSLDDNGEAEITAEMIDNGSFDNCTDVTLSIEPSTFTCADVGENQVWLTVTDEYGNFNQTWSTVTIYDMSGGVLSCNTGQIVDVTNGPVQLFVSDILESYSGICEESLVLTIETSGGFIVPDNIITSDLAGQALTAAVTDQTGNSCWGTVNVIGDATSFFICDTECWNTPFTDCAQGHSEEDNIEWPCNIEVFALGADPSLFSPENLVNIYNVNPFDAEPNIVNHSGIGVVMSYNDVVIDVNQAGTFFKIIRTWTVLDWLTAEVYEYVHIISNLDFSSSICDTLSRLSPVGDCDTGHSLEDDVEWPEDLFLSDHRLAPEELISVSNVDPLDASPSFYNDPDNYIANYTDLFIELTPDLLTLDRVWTVTNSQFPGLMWNYSQTLFIDISDFSGLVTVNTIFNRPVPGVELNAQDVTNQSGAAVVEPGSGVAPFRSDELKNGLSIRDLALMRMHILGIDNLNDLQLRAADLTDDLFLTTLDFVLLQKAILGLDSNVNPNWEFVESDVNSNVDTKAHYIAYKPGDVDDSASLDGTDSYEEGYTVEYKDLLINAGESYDVPIYLNENVDIMGYELRLDIDISKIEVVEIESVATGLPLDWNIENDELTIISLSNNLDIVNLDGTSDDPLLNIRIMAKENTVLGWSMFFNELRNSFILDDAMELILLNGSINGEITSGTYDFSESFNVLVYPNPASDVINIDFEDELDNATISLFDIKGQKVLNQNLSNRLDVSMLSSGTYMLLIESAQKHYRQLLQVY